MAKRKPTDVGGESDCGKVARAQERSGSFGITRYPAAGIGVGIPLKRAGMRVEARFTSDTTWELGSRTVVQIRPPQREGSILAEGTIAYGSSLVRRTRSVRFPSLAHISSAGSSIPRRSTNQGSGSIPDRSTATDAMFDSPISHVFAGEVRVPPGAQISHPSVQIRVLQQGRFESLRLRRFDSPQGHKSCRLTNDDAFGNGFERGSIRRPVYPP